MNPQSWNWYSYVLNNPLSLVDPTGMDIWFPGPCEDPEDPECGGGLPIVPPCLFFDCGDGGSGQGGGQTAPPPPPPTTTPPPQNQGGVYGCSQNGDPVPCVGTNPTWLFASAPLIPTFYALATTHAPLSTTDAQARCINGLLLEAGARAVASFIGLPLDSNPSFADLAGVVKGAVGSPAFKVAAVYTATNIAKRLVTRRVAIRLAARVGSQFVPFVGQAAAVYLVGQAAWGGLSWYKDQIGAGACEF
jgi:hypothetical protein